jgi:hypothetical protein
MEDTHRGAAEAVARTDARTTARWKVCILNDMIGNERLRKKSVCCCWNESCCFNWRPRDPHALYDVTGVR